MDSSYFTGSGELTDDQKKWLLVILVVLVIIAIFAFWPSSGSSSGYGNQIMMAQRAQQMQQMPPKSTSVNNPTTAPSIPLAPAANRFCIGTGTNYGSGCMNGTSKQSGFGGVRIPAAQKRYANLAGALV